MSTFDVAARAGVDAAAGSDLLAGVAAALPAGFWSAACVVGVSGGGDSVALLLALHRLADVDARLVVTHVEHDLRDSASRDREFVAQLATQLSRPCVVRHVAVRTADRAGEGLEATARRLRYAALAEVARECGARHVAVAHTADDQAETVLHRILRGTGLTGLGGMAAARELCPGIGLVRPLLGLPRDLVRAGLVSFGVGWCEDETNADLRHARNFLRHEILARCTAGPYPAAPSALARLAGQAAAAGAALRSAAGHLLESHAVRQADGSVVVRTAGLAGLHPHLQAELFVALWIREGWPQRDMSARHYAALADRLRAVSQGAATAPLELPGPVRMTAGRDRLELARTGST